MSGTGDWSYGTVFKIFVWGYLIGGLTLLPAVGAFIWFWATTPVDKVRLDALQAANVSESSGRRRHSSGSTKELDEDSHSLGIGLDSEILEKLKRRTHVPDVFAGYFAVCREYVPGGINGKPPDRTTPAGAVISMESPSVYQSMYRSIFDRNKTLSPTIEASNARSKRARNVFYVVLRLGHLMLYDNEDQLEVRHVISLTHYKVDLYSGGEPIPEGELWIKRNCIRLSQKLDDDVTAESKSFYLFSDSCSEKEDFYHAMLQAQEHNKDQTPGSPLPAPLKFETPDLVKLVQQLHASEENLHTRWINALVGRIFLAMYKTDQIKAYIASKINKKIARVPKPALISNIQLRKVDMGTLPPFMTNPKLKELTVDGDLIVEADISYKGNFRIEISATARIDLGSRFKAREVTLVLAGILKRLDGHILLRIKPPPSNRLWMTFEVPPRMELSLEPIVSSRQITWGVILRAMESRIREVVNETLVLPNWDDTPFTDTIAQMFRGGIWEDSQGKEEELPKVPEEVPGLDATTMDVEKADDKSDANSFTLSIPSSIETGEPGVGISSSTDYKSPAARPRGTRSTSSVHVDSANASAETFHDRSSATPTSTRSVPPPSPSRSSMRSVMAESVTDSPSTSTEDVSTPSLPTDSADATDTPSTSTRHARSNSKQDLSEEQIAAAAAAAAGAHMNKRPTLNQSFNVATAAARNWLASKQQQTAQAQRPANTPDPDAEVQPDAHHQPPLAKSHTTPMGRGQPLPPPGTPLPLPPGKRPTWNVPLPKPSAFANLAKRKPVSGLGDPHPHSPLPTGGECAEAQVVGGECGGGAAAAAEEEV
ncbi:hypothetical protein P153DRAFT_429436 [Dothidotthia symphoricarpi CBS 119687]|uniref:SMP-LTD domain-containing protein n=1 Tax=Dothidotthia symphoricarpi CBS 119687 TaxID=1392245 RepID=A0A6A6AJX2_9PLEO|nr:uncharacterized protein P153DRAFT_429436 [Dothidotthia symphoricarpi CBS 119687]KAF2132272.1 hypothetical protein P153DRAFT_429436 [Dothidotthia symphoricarpi CBS 119687]